MVPAGDIDFRARKDPEADEEAIQRGADRGHPAGGPVGREDGGAALPRARDRGADVLRLEAEVRVDGRAGREAAARAGEGERAAQAAAGRARRRAGRGEGVPSKKVSDTPARREAAAFLIGRAISGRRACWWLGVSRSWLKYASRKKDGGGELVERLMALAKEHPRYGVRRLHA